MISKADSSEFDIMNLRDDIANYFEDNFPAVIPSARNDNPQEAVIAAALLTATAFRMRDEAGLIAAIRQLCGVVSEFETSNDNLVQVDALTAGKQSLCQTKLAIS